MFGINLIRIRNAKNLSQVSLSHIADIPLSQIGRIERGEINTTINTVYILSKALETDILEFFKFDVKNNS